MKCALSFRGTDGQKHICDIEKGVGHAGVHYCEAHGIYETERFDEQPSFVQHSDEGL